jgi:hypothetical protein
MTDKDSSLSQARTVVGRIWLSFAVFVAACLIIAGAGKGLSSQDTVAGLALMVFGPLVVFGIYRWGRWLFAPRQP